MTAKARPAMIPQFFRLLPQVLLLAAIVLTTITRSQAADVPEFTNWPEGVSPSEVGKRVTERFLATPHIDPDDITYPEVCAWYGALEFSRISGEQELLRRLISRFDPLMTPAESHLIPSKRHVDFSVFGAVPLEIYLETRQASYREMGLNFADRQWENPTPDGLSPETRYWIDDMYMITILQVQAYRASNDTKYLDRAAREMSAYLDRLQQPSGLFFHAPDTPFYWGRGNGWVAAGMTELLTAMPAGHPLRPRILHGYRKMMSALLKFQGKDGMWRQLIDHPEAWPETSSTGMFTFAMVTGVKHGWLDRRQYALAARKAWIGLAGYLDQNSDLTSVCEGTGKKNDLPYYFARRRRTGDLHGQAPVLWSAAALLRK